MTINEYTEKKVTVSHDVIAWDMVIPDDASTLWKKNTVHVTHALIFKFA